MNVRIFFALILASAASGCTAPASHQAALAVQQALGASQINAISTGPSAQVDQEAEELALLLDAFRPGLLPETW